VMVRDIEMKNVDRGRTPRIDALRRKCTRHAGFTAWRVQTA
jgi:hypothetical protein